MVWVAIALAIGGILYAWWLKIEHDRLEALWWNDARQNWESIHELRAKVKELEKDRCHEHASFMIS